MKGVVINSAWMRLWADNPYMIGDVWGGTDNTGCVTSATICEAALMINPLLMYLGWIEVMPFRKCTSDILFADLERFQWIRNILAAIQVRPIRRMFRIL